MNYLAEILSKKINMENPRSTFIFTEIPEFISISGVLIRRKKPGSKRKRWSEKITKKGVIIKLRRKIVALDVYGMN